LHNFTKLIESVDFEQVDKALFKREWACSLVLTKDRKILLQMRSDDRKSFPGCISTFGGSLEEGEKPIQALIRELHEELGANVSEADIVSFGVITEAVTKYTELVYVYFWHDRFGTITGCYEDSPLYFNDIASVIAHPKVMDYVPWLLEKCKNRGFLV
jgi:8-oxo-dGTP diphosphatase